jgi:hypothetical protein
MRFLHVGDNICGIPSALARAQREAGHQADVMSFTVDKQGHLADYQYNESNPMKRVLQLLQKVSSYDVLQFVGNSLLPRGADIPLWRLMGKKVTVHYHGSDIRGRKQYFGHKFATKTYVSTPDLLEYVPDAIWLPNPIFADEYPKWNPKPMTFVHATTDPALSGTKYLLESLLEVNRVHPLAKLDVVGGVAYPQALKRYCEASIAIEKIDTVGYIGMFGLECMAIGIPVMCYITPKIRNRYFKLPYPVYVLNHALAHTLDKEMVHLLYDEDYQHLLSVEGRKYVTSVHNPKRIVSMITKSLAKE